MVKIKCVYCKKIFYVKPSRKKLHKYLFCSRECHYKFRSVQNRKNTHCDFCRKSISKTRSRFRKNKHNFCSQKCFFNFRRENRDKFNYRIYNVNWQFLGKIYQKENLSINDLAKKFKLPSAIIWYHLNKLNFTRSKKEAMKILSTRLKISRAAKKRFKKSPHPMLGKPGIWKGKKRPEHSKMLTGRDKGGKVSKKCPICGVMFISFKSLKQKTCSFQCGHRLRSKLLRGEKATNFKNRKIFLSCLICGKKFYRFKSSRKAKFYNTCSKTCQAKAFSLFIFGDRSGNWLGGISKEPYPLIWRNSLKEEIREAFGYRCQLCGVPQIECLRKLCVHHINYNKKDCSVKNLIPLCNQCNVRVNIHRTFWKDYFKQKIKERYENTCTLSS